MMRDPTSPQSRRRTGLRYTILVLIMFALIAGWSGFWKFAASRAETNIEGWRAREAKAGRIYSCRSQNVGGYPFRIEVDCDQASALLRSSQPPVELKTRGLVVVSQVYQPGLLVSEFRGPLTIGEPGRSPDLIADWKLAQSSVRGTPAAPERGSLVLDQPVVDRIYGDARQNILRARHIAIHGRMAEGSADDRPVIEVALQVDQASAPTLHPATVQPIDANVTAFLHGLNDFSPEPWSARFQEMQTAGGRIDITKARVQQGEILAVGGGALSLNGNGRLEGELRITMAGLDQFLAAIGAQQKVQTSPNMEKLVGVLDRLAPGLGDVARQQAGANISLGINLLGEQTTLEGKRAVSLPLRFNDGAIFLGPIPIGNAPALF
ncbi:MAG TPA: DUF2125 domain-containing protein [Pseudolabrys sp.]|jgi:hypothetical protein|nr:DUF2125 domain-containing protein [Pseudolabrys sp.]